jgi:hypothetical protein
MKSMQETDSSCATCGLQGTVSNSCGRTRPASVGLFHSLINISAGSPGKSIDLIKKLVAP